MKAMLLMPFKDEFNNVHEAIKDAVADCALHFSKCDESVSRAKQLATISPDRVDYGHGAAVILSDLKRE